MDLGAYWYQSLALVFELDVDHIDGWEILLLVCVAGPRYHTEGLPGIPSSGHRGFLHMNFPCPLVGVQFNPLTK